MKLALFIALIIIIIAYNILSKKNQPEAIVAEPSSTWEVRIFDNWNPTIARNNPDTLFIFSDNEDKVGKKHQANIRDEPNAEGIPVKHRPYHNEDSFFDDQEFESNKISISAAFSAIKTKLSRLNKTGFKYRYIAFHNNGIGKEELSKRAPQTYHFLLGKIEELCEYDKDKSWMPWFNNL